MLAAVIQLGIVVCVRANAVAGTLDAVVAVGMVVSVKVEPAEIVGVDDAVAQLGMVVCVHDNATVGIEDADVVLGIVASVTPIANAGVVAAVTHDGITVCVQESPSPVVGVDAAVVQVGTTVRVTL